MNLRQSMCFAMLFIPANLLQAQSDLGKPPTESGANSQVLDIRKLLTQFDNDDDGQLNSVERARVRLYIQNRNQQQTKEEKSRQVWDNVVSRFDSNEQCLPRRFKSSSSKYIQSTCNIAIATCMH